MEARGEIEDLTMEHETEREELLDSIRNQNKELQLWEQVRTYAARFAIHAAPWSRSQQQQRIPPFAAKQPSLAHVCRKAKYSLPTSRIILRVHLSLS